MFSLVHQLHPILLPYVSNNIKITIRIPFLYRRIWNKEFRKIEISVPLVSVLVKNRNRKSKQRSPSKIVSKIRVKGSRPVGILKSLAIEQKFTPPATMAIDSRDHHQYHPSKIFYLPWSTRTYELLVTRSLPPLPPFPLEIRFDCPTTSRRLIPIPSTITLEIDASRTTIRFRSGRNSGALPDLNTTVHYRVNLGWKLAWIMQL